jgi:hypothetical protein
MSASSGEAAGDYGDYGGQQPAAEGAAPAETVIGVNASITPSPSGVSLNTLPGGTGQQVFCTQCGVKNSSTAKFCPSCGAASPAASPGFAQATQPNATLQTPAAGVMTLDSTNTHERHWFSLIPIAFLIFSGGFACVSAGHLNDWAVLPFDVPWIPRTVGYVAAVGLFVAAFIGLFHLFNTSGSTGLKRASCCCSCVWLLFTLALVVLTVLIYTWWIQGYEGVTKELCDAFYFPANSYIGPSQDTYACVDARSALHMAIAAFIFHFLSEIAWCAIPAAKPKAPTISTKYQVLN